MAEEWRPYGVTRGEWSFRGPTSKWKRGKFRKEAERNPVRDDNQTREGNIREAQVRLKNAWASKRLASREAASSRKTTKRGAKKRTMKRGSSRSR